MLRRRAPKRLKQPDWRDSEHRDTGPNFWTRQEVMARFGGRCARCGQPGESIQHRKPRGAGGTKNPAINALSNLIWVCGDGVRGCHGHMESYRTEAYRLGWLVRDRGNPAKIAVRLWDGRDVLLDDDGGAQDVPATKEDPPP
jgi:5-methylcytosine-specific restriction protein A